MATKGKKVLGKIPEATLVEIREAKLEATVAAAIAQEKEAVLNRHLIQAFVKAKQPNEGRIVCLDCGEIRLKDVPHECSA